MSVTDFLVAEATSTTLFVFPHGDGAFVADLAVRPGLRCVDRVSAPAAPGHVPVVACAPHRADRPAGIVVGVTVGSARWWHDHPDKVANKVVGELVARFGHGDVVPRTTERKPSPSEHLVQCVRAQLVLCGVDDSA
jgi:hypothetical protein